MLSLGGIGAGEHAEGTPALGRTFRLLPAKGTLRELVPTKAGERINQHESRRG